MDEILASIRRIIESNEPPVGAPAPLVPVSIDDSTPADDRFDDEIIIADFHAEEFRRTPAGEETAQPVVASVQPEARPPQPAMSLADVAARVRAASERNGMMLREVGERTAPADGAPFSPFDAVGIAQAAVADVPGRETAVGPIGSEQPRMDQQAHRSSPSRQEEAPSSAASASLVSPTVSAQVSGSFGVLAEAVQAGPRRSFDEIAEDMLRPMLQEWLDDNLPTLVERLVREEIERVARGPRR